MQHFYLDGCHKDQIINYIYLSLHIVRMTFLLFLLFPFSIVYSQRKNADGIAAKHHISFELGKTGLVYNLVYDYKFAKNGTGFRAAIGSNFGRYHSIFSGGAGIYQLFGGAKKHFEAGADLYYLYADKISDDQKGLSFVYPDYSTKTYYATINLGYRYTSQKKLFRIGISPGITKDEFLPGGYISFGIALN